MSDSIGRKRVDYTGQTFGLLTIVQYDEKTSKRRRESCYICKCQCGNITNPIGITDLKRGHTKSCGCLLKVTCAINGSLGGDYDMVGKTFGKLTVTRMKEKSEYINKKPRVIEWYCNCSCGTKNVVVEGTMLRSGRIKSCGCLTKESAHNRYKDLTGQVFGKLTVIKPIEEDYIGRKSGVKWLCKCQCGCYKIFTQNSLEQHKVLSCGCIVSKNEYKIREILLDNNIVFMTQYQFDDCINPKTGRKLKYDFAIFTRDLELSFLLEYDGEQHSQQQRYSKSPETNKRKFEELLFRDSIKNQYAKQNSITLIRIPYTEKENIKDIIEKNLYERGLIYGVSS